METDTTLACPNCGDGIEEIRERGFGDLETDIDEVELATSSKGERLSAFICASCSSVLGFAHYPRYSPNHGIHTMPRPSEKSAKRHVTCPSCNSDVIPRRGSHYRASPFLDGNYREGKCRS